MSHQNYKTLHYNGRQVELEFVVSVKGRPFAILPSSNFPTPDVTLVDYNLICDQKLAMTDLQCIKAVIPKPFSIALTLLPLEPSDEVKHLFYHC